MNFSFKAVCRAVCFIAGRSSKAQPVYFSFGKSIFRFASTGYAILLLVALPYSEVFASATPTTTSGNASNGATYYGTYGCTGCHTNPTSPYPAQLNAANSGSLVSWMNSHYSMGSAIPNSTVANDIAAYIATYVSLVTSTSTSYNTASTAQTTHITKGAASYPLAISAITTQTAPTKGNVSYSTGTTPYVPNFTYTPTSGACGSDSFAYGGTGEDSTSKRTVTVTIGNPPVPSITSGATATGTYNTNATQYTVTQSSTQSTTLCGVTNFSATSVTYSAAASGYTTTSTGWPAGVSLNTTSGAVSGTPSSPGTYTITVYALNPGGASTGKSVTFTVNKANQTISFNAAPTVLYNGTGTVTTTSGASGNAVSYASSTPAACSVNSSTGAVTGLAVGTNNCTITADQTGNANYNAATQATQTFSIGKGNQTISFGGAPTVVVSGTGTASATATSGLAITYTSTTTAACSVNSTTGVVTGIVAGTNNCTIAANQAGNANYNAATQATQTFSIGKGNQTISFGGAPTVVVSGTGTASATATSALAITYSSTTTAACSVNSTTGVVTGIAAGTNNCTIAANQAGDANYNAATQATQTFSIGKGNQTISFGGAPTVVVSGTGTASATATSGLAITYSSTTTAACSVNASTGVVTGIAAGTNNCTITADQAGNANYNAATQVTQTFSIGKGNQTISFNAAPTVLYNGTGTVTTTSGASGNAVSYSSSTSAACSVNSTTGVVTGIAAGTSNCTIAANQAGNANYNAATQATQTFSIGKANQTISFGAAPSIAVSGTGTVSANATSGLSITFSSNTTSICTVAGTTVTGVGAGTCIIQANQAGDSNYSVATQTQNIAVGLTSQTISFGAAPTIIYGGTGTVTATASSGLAVDYSSFTAGICSVNTSSGLVNALAAGVCTIAADQPGDTTYAAAPQETQTFSISKANQTLSFGGAPTIVVGSTGTASATATSALAITYSSTTTAACSVNASTGVVTGIAAGTNNCTITANQVGNANYNAATQDTQTFSISKANQTISFGSAPSVTVGGTGVASATTTSGLAITYSSTTTGACSVNASTGAVTGIVAGTNNCTIAANQPGDVNYNAASQVTQSFSIAKGGQTISFGASPTVAVGGTGTVTATGGASGNPVTFTSSTSGICTVSGSTVTGIATGTCTIDADQAGDANYNAAPQVTQAFGIGKAGQSISFGAAPTITVGGTGSATATATSGLAVSYSSNTPVVCSVNGSSGLISGLTAGTCTIAANQAGDTNYNSAALVTQNVTIGQGSQSLNFGAAPSLTVGGSGALSATGGGSGNPIVFNSTTTGVCTVSGSTVTGVSVGSCVITADQAGNANFAAASQATQTFSVGKGNQSISFGAAPTIAVGGSGLVLASATSGLAISYSSTTTTVCSVNSTSGQVSGLTAGSCTIAANEPGNASYNSATQVTQTFSIGQGSQSITFGTAPTIAIGGTGTVSATASSGLAVTLTSTTTTVCTISGNTVTGINLGTCTIAADQPGNANYAAAPQVTQSMAIANLPPNVGAVTISTSLNTAKTFDLAPYITGVGVTGVSISQQPMHGSVSVSGTKVTYTPTKDYFGTDTFAYQAYGVAGVSPNSAIVTVTIIGRPNPLQDKRVTGLINIQAAALTRFGKAQIFNFQQRLESRHQGSSAPSVSDSSGGSTPAPAPAATRSAVPEQNRNYFNSWQPGTVLSYVNDPNTLIHAPDRPKNGQELNYDPAVAALMGAVSGMLTSSTLNLNSITNATAVQNQEDEFGRLEVWAAGNLRFGTRLQGGTDTRFSTDGVSVGVDKRIDRQFTVGMGVGYARDNSSIGTDGTTSTSSGNSMAGYFSYQRDSGTFLDGLLGYGKVGFDTNRYVPSVDDFARAKRKGDQIFGSLSLGYESHSEGLLWSPYGRYDFSYSRLGVGTESGAGNNALSYAEQNTRSSQIALGIRIESVHQTSFGVVQPHARFEYQRSFDINGETSVSYADLLSTQYTLAATSQSNNSVALGLGSDFVLSDTLRFAIDYQRLRSNSAENSQSINFRITKTLNGKNDLDGLLVESYPSSINKLSGLVVAAGFAYDDNVSRASDALDKLSDTIYGLTISKAKSFVMSEHTKLTVSGFLDVEKFRTYAGLGHVSGGGQGEYAYRPSGEFGSPIYAVFARLTYDQYESTLRDGSRRSVGVTLRKPLTDRIKLFMALADNVRLGKSDVFNTRDDSFRMNLDYALATNQTIYLTGEYRKGDLISSGQPSLKILDLSYVFVRDDVFNTLGFYDYRMKGKTGLLTLGYNVALGAKDSMDFSWRRVQSTPDKTLPYAARVRYIDNQFSISYLMAF